MLTVAGAALAGFVGVAAGTGAFTFGYGRGASYLTDDPAACANCHVMQAHYDAWLRSSHRAAATCNSCHTPKAAVPKYAVKASNGFWHSVGFTTGRFPDPIRIKPGNRAVTEARCRYCHDTMTAAIDGRQAPEERRPCTDCHGDVGHRLR